MTATLHTYNRLIIRTLRTLAVLVAVCLALVLPAACSSSADDDYMPLPAPEKVPGGLQAGFTLTVSSPGESAASRGSRATPSDGTYDPGAGYENYIDITSGDFRFYFFGAEGDDENVYLGQLKVNSLLPTGQTATSKTYYVMGEVPRDIREKKLKIVVLANWRHQYSFATSGNGNSSTPGTGNGPAAAADADGLTPGVSTIADLWGVTYDFTPQSMLLSATNTIPLYGVSRPATLSFDVDNFARFPHTIHLLRAFAKVEVLLNAENTEYTIRRVSLTRHNTSGYCAPDNVVDESDYVHGSYDKDYVELPHIPAGNESAVELDFIKVADDDFIVYIPEYLNIGRDPFDKAIIRVEFNGSWYPYQEVEFKYYDKADQPAFNILRNYWYRFTLNKSPERDEVVVQVVPYAQVPLTPDFGLILGPNFVPIYDDFGNVSLWYDTKTGKYYERDRKTEVPNPFIGRDPTTGYCIIRDDNGNLLYYYDETTGKYFDKDDVTKEIPNPYITLDPATGWIILRDKNGVVYYYDERTGKYYAADKKTEIPDPSLSNQ